MTDFASLGIKIDSTDVEKGSKSIDDLTTAGTKAETSTKKLASATEVLANAAKAAAGAFAAFKILDHIKEVALLNARYETLGVSMRVVGGHAGYTSSQMDAAEMSLRKTGISMIEARQQALRLVQAHIDLADSTKLARIAQDAAVIGGINSSEAFDRMIHGITTGQTEILRGIGINVSMDASYKTMAATLHKHADQLSQNEKMQAIVNAVMEKGKDIAGTYEAAMDTAGKQITSMTRYTEDLKVKQGEVFNEALTIAVMAWTAHLKDANGEIDKLAQNNELEAWGNRITNVMAFAADSVDGVVNVVKILGLTIASTAAMIANALNPSMVGSIKEAYDADVDKILASQGRFARAVDERRAAMDAKKGKVAEAERRHQEDMTNIMLYYTNLRINGMLSEQKYLETVTALNNQANDGHHYDNPPAPVKEHEGLSEYQKLTKAIKEKIAAQNIEIALGEDATAGQRDYQKLLTDISGGYLKLKPVEIARLATLHDQNMANERAITLTAQRIAIEKSFEKEASEIHGAWLDAHKDTLADLRKEIDAQVEHNATVGLSKEALAALADAKIADAVATKERELAALRGTAADAEQLDLIRAEIDALQTLRSLKTIGAQKDAAFDAAKKAADEWKKTAETIERSLTDALMRGFESGKSFGENLRDTLVNMFKSMILRPVIQATVQGGMQALGMGGTSGGVGALLSTGSSAYNMFNGGPSAMYSNFATSGVGQNLGLSAVQTPYDALATGGDAYSALAADTATMTELGGTMTETAATMTELGSTIGAALPWVGGAMAAYTVLDSLGVFGSNGPVNRSTKYQRDLGASSTGSSSFMNNFRFSDSEMMGSLTAYDASAISGEKSLIASLHLTSEQIQSINAELKKSADTVYGAGMEHTDVAQSGLFGQVSADRMQAIATALGKSIGEIAAAMDPLFASLVTAGKQIGLTADELGKMAAKSGGIQALTADITAYHDAYYTAAEKNAELTASVSAEFEKLNEKMPTSREAYRALIEGLGKTTDAELVTYSSTLKLAGAVGQLADAAAAADAATRKALIDDSMSAVNAAYSALERSVAAQKTAIDKTYATQSKDRQDAIAASGKIRDNLGTLADALTGAVDTVRAESDALTMARRDAAQVTLDAALTAAQSGQSLEPFSKSITGAIADLSKPSKDLYGSFEQYAYAQGRANGVLSQLKDSAVAQKSVADLTLDAISGAARDAELQHADDLARLDQTLSDAKTQIDILNGINVSVLTIPQALAELAAALATAGVVKTTLTPKTTAPGATTAGIIADYQNILGRAPDAAGLTYWSQQAAGGMSAADIASAFTNSTENQVQNLYESVLGRTADTGGAAYWTAQLNAGASLADVQAAMMQSSEYINGSHAGGLASVPYDGYIAELHGGEGVLTASENKAYRSARQSMTDDSRLVAELQALRAELVEMKQELSEIKTTNKNISDITEKSDAIGPAPARAAL